MTERAPLALPNDRLAWNDGEVKIDGRLWEIEGIGETPTGWKVARAHIGQNRWRTVSLPPDTKGVREIGRTPGEWGWDHDR